jgi:transcriptional regulator with XRE-family HTH domain
MYDKGGKMPTAVSKQHLLAPGAYVQHLREMRRLSQQEVAELAGTTDVTISRIERGIHEPKSSLVKSIMHALGGSVDAFYRLLLDENASREDGERIAREWLEANQQTLASFTPTQRDEFNRRLLRLLELLEQDIPLTEAIRQILHGES